jgi:glycosyltransferase involved in cell wall biosynthesis
VLEQVHFLGARSDVPELFATFDVYCLPSHYEGMPLTVLEAMAAGKPVVATNVVGIGEVVTHDKTGLLVPPDDPDALAQALMRVRQDRNLCRDLAEAGRAYAFMHARLKTMVDQYAALYEQVLAV